MDRTWRLSSYVRGLLGQGKHYTEESRGGFRIDLAGLKRVAQMGSWQPRYVDLNPSQERLAETVLKWEREVYGIKRPRQLANRDVVLRIGDPIDLGPFIPAYLQDAQAVRHGVALQLRDVIQALIDAMGIPPKRQASESDERTQGASETDSNAIDAPKTPENPRNTTN